MKPQKPNEPIIKRDTDLGWELFLPQHMLPAELRVVSVSPAGLYIETVTDTWDLITFQDLADLVDVGSRSLDENIDIDCSDHNRSLIARLTYPAITVQAGQPEPIITGKERAYRRWDADQGYQFTYPGGQ